MGGKLEEVAELAPSELSIKEFRGVERFYPARIVFDAHTADELVLGIKAGKPYSISKEQLDGSKSKLLGRFLQVSDAAELAAFADSESTQVWRAIMLRLRGIPEYLAKFLPQDVERWAKVIHAAGISAD